MVMNMWFFTILYFCEIFTDFVDKVIDGISKIFFTGSHDVPVEISKSRVHTSSAVDKKCVKSKRDSVKKDNERCCLATTPAEARGSKVNGWKKLYNNLRTFFRIFRICRKL